MKIIKATVLTEGREYKGAALANTDFLDKDGHFIDEIVGRVRPWDLNDNRYFAYSDGDWLLLESAETYQETDVRECVKKQIVSIEGDEPPKSILKLYAVVDDWAYGVTLAVCFSLHRAQQEIEKLQRENPEQIYDMLRIEEVEVLAE